ncbi:hypothetical protein [Paraburkholderia sp. BL10I2N1]|uniref:hypothetical protein n=1 Tax=Paraburkholderia sp. BL10I2N1 TaxID=1938796 RepID=UPI00105D1421|nr:hypothetical protein [Paraburkholderia sp. BL10I2N1]TDN63201.1 hypothetical protein B0G77_6831 [Paraburkholderia sp. BL10I2N1]
MNGNSISLHSLVDKWLAPTLSMPARVTQFGHTVSTHLRYVRLEGGTTTGQVSIIFFQHRDGSWCVLPPVSARPAMCTRLFAA